MRTEATVVGRNTKMKACWIRVPHKYGWKILTLSDDVLPFGMKTATKVLIEWDGKVSTGQSGYTADIEVLEDLSNDEGTGTPDDN